MSSIYECKEGLIAGHFPGFTLANYDTNAIAYAPPGADSPVSMVAAVYFVPSGVTLTEDTDIHQYLCARFGYRDVAIKYSFDAANDQIVWGIYAKDSNGEYTEQIEGYGYPTADVTESTIGRFTINFKNSDNKVVASYNGANYYFSTTDHEAFPTGTYTNNCILKTNENVRVPYGNGGLWWSYDIIRDLINNSCNVLFDIDTDYKLTWNVVAEDDTTILDDQVASSKLKILKSDGTVAYEDTDAKTYEMNEFDMSDATAYPAGDYTAVLYAYGNSGGETGWKPTTPYSFTITRGGVTYTAGLRGVWIGKTFTKTTKIKSFTVYTANTSEGVPFGSIASPEGIVLYRLDALSNAGTAEIDVYDSESETTTKTTVQKWTCSPDKTITCYAGKTYYFIISPYNWGTNNIQYYITNKADGNCFELPDASAPAYSCKSAISYDLGDYTYVGSSSTVPENPVENGLYLDSNADTHTAWDGTTTSVNRCYMHFADGEWHYVCSYGNWDSPIDQFITDSKYASTKNYYLTITEDI